MLDSCENFGTAIENWNLDISQENAGNFKYTQEGNLQYYIQLQLELYLTNNLYRCSKIS
jgi:hypothetical protein